MKLMLDRSVISYSKTYQWNKEYEYSSYLQKTVGVLREREVTNNNISIEADISALKILGNQHSDSLSFFTYPELGAESDRASFASMAAHSIDLNNIMELQSPIDRSYFGGVWLSDMASKDKFTEFLEKLFKYSGNDWMNSGFSNRFTPFHMKSLKSFNAFKAICLSVDKTHFPDLFHLWATKCHNLDGFLTMDYKLKRLYFDTLKTPSALGLPITPTDVLLKIESDI